MAAMDSEQNINSQAEAQGPAPTVAGVRLGPGFAVGLYVLLAASAGLAFFGRRFPGRLPADLERAIPVVFGAFVACFALYRLGLASARKYPASKAFFQVGLALAVFLLLLPSGRAPYVDAGPALALVPALHDPNPRVRALAAELARYRPEGRDYVGPLVDALTDPDPSVRAEAHASLVRLTGRDPGPPDVPGALEAWRRLVP